MVEQEGSQRLLAFTHFIHQMTKYNEIRVSANKSNTFNSASNSTSTVSYEKFETEKNAKNQAYDFILTYGHLDAFRSFCKGEKADETTVKLTQLQIRELFEIMGTLHGEEAVDSAYLATQYPNSEIDHDIMLKNTLRFYSNVRYLVTEIKRHFTPPLQ